MLNNGTILLQRGYSGGAGKKDINTGLSWANRKVGNNIMVILKKLALKTEQLKIVYQDINKLYNFFGY